MAHYLSPKNSTDPPLNDIWQVYVIGGTDATNTVVSIPRALSTKSNGIVLYFLEN